MGTNFYLDDPTKRLRRGVHVGKRSAAGLYCWDCRITLCRQGAADVHCDSDWYGECPCCGKGQVEEPLEESSVGRELGFNKSKPKKKTGVRSCSSFSWAIHPTEIFLKEPGPNIVSEYGEIFDPDKFREILLECSIQYYDMIGREFS